MKFRIRNAETGELYTEDVFLHPDGTLYNRDFERIGVNGDYVVEPLLFHDKNEEEVYKNDDVIYQEDGERYRASIAGVLKNGVKKLEYFSKTKLIRMRK